MKLPELIKDLTEKFDKRMSSKKWRFKNPSKYAFDLHQVLIAPGTQEVASLMDRDVVGEKQTLQFLSFEHTRRDYDFEERELRTASLFLTHLETGISAEELILRGHYCIPSFVWTVPTLDEVVTANKTVIEYCKIVQFEHDRGQCETI